MSDAKIQIMAVGGMLGQAVARAAKRAGLTYCAVRHDIANLPDNAVVAPIVINCAAVLGSGKTELCEAVNTRGPQVLSEQCDRVGSRLIHVSTDAVFSTEGPHSEDSRPRPQDPYGVSKLRGEIVRAPHLTVRTAFIGLGRYGVLAELLRGEAPVKASDKLLWTGHTVDTVAELLIVLGLRSDITGLIHIPGEAWSRWQLVNHICERLGNCPEIIRDDSMVSDRRLCSLRWGTLGLPTPPSFTQQVDRLLQGQEWLEYQVSVAK